jgi:hypothetical protein
MMLAQPTNALFIQVISENYPPKSKDIVPPSQNDVEKDDRQDQLQRDLEP